MERGFILGVLCLHSIQASKTTLPNCQDVNEFKKVVLCTTDSHYNARKPANEQIPLVVGNTVNFFNVDSNIWINTIWYIFCYL